MLVWEPRTFTPAEVAEILSVAGTFRAETDVRRPPRLVLTVRGLGETLSRQLAQHLGARAFYRDGEALVQWRGRALLAYLAEHEEIVDLLDEPRRVELSRCLDVIARERAVRRARAVEGGRRRRAPRQA